MAQTTGIEWTDSTFNPWIGCTNISAGCDHCYAETMNKHRGWTEWGPHGERRRTSVQLWDGPRKWNRDAAKWQAEHGRRQRVFCASLADVFDNKAPQAWREDLWKLIRETPELDWLLLTKRPMNIAKMLPADWGDGYPNVWLGTTTEDQAAYDQRWPHLARIPACVRFLSYEPAIGPVRMSPAHGLLPDWVISGGESGPGARRMHPDWASSMQAQCEPHGIAFFHKQWGDYQSNPHVVIFGRTKREAEELDPKTNGKGGGLLLGRLWREFPTCGRQIEPQRQEALL